MTTWLRHIGASIMGILDPVPSTAPSPMPPQEGAWVRANAWTTALRKIDAAYPHGFHRWCSCEAGTCHPCRTGHHDQCISAHGPRTDDHAGTLTDRGGFVLALIHHRPHQQPCRWTCPCTHTAAPHKGAATETAMPKPRPDRPARPAPASAPPAAGQLSLFDSGQDQQQEAP
ncbi:DUF6248 family natural product biosynthesis protein [Streptomyces sp. cg36]|uniref:DUF6248 family natural product biosynthesis protein n=1 Tax=Streptomyces sp. cg36 TaxID=3238798 RepID=UPI0034E25C8F